jgi:hypothetical protein
LNDDGQVVPVVNIRYKVEFVEKGNGGVRIEVGEGT